MDGNLLPRIESYDIFLFVTSKIRQVTGILSPGGESPQGSESNHYEEPG